MRNVEWVRRAARKAAFATISCSVGSRRWEAGKRVGGVQNKATVRARIHVRNFDQVIKNPVE